MKTLSTSIIAAALLLIAVPAHADPAYAARHAVDSTGHAIVHAGRATGHAIVNGGRDVGHAAAVTGRDTVHGVRHVLHIHRRRHHHTD